MKKLILFVVLPLLLLIGAGLGALVAGMVPGVVIPGLTPAPPVVVEKDPGAPPTYLASPQGAVIDMLPEFVVNVRSNRTYPVFLLVSLAVELVNEAARPALAAQEARIRDAMIIYLSSLTPNDLNGYEGIQLIRDNSWRILQEFVDPKLMVNVQVAKLTVK